MIAQLRVSKPDLEDMIRDELYAFKHKKRVKIPLTEVRKIAERIARRCIIGH